MNPLDVALEAAYVAGELLREGWRRGGFAVEPKSAQELVTEYDRRCEALIIDILQKTFPAYAILGEESGAGKGTQTHNRWIIDPLDGTTNFARGYPLFGVSIALERSGEVVVGVVYNPLADECFTAEKGAGAALNQKSIRVASTSSLAAAVVASGFPYDAWTSANDNTDLRRIMVKRELTVRCDGAAALDLCAVACGRFDAYWEHGLAAWDIAAGALIAQEAGALVTDYRGGDAFLRRGEVIAAPAALHAEIVALFG
ncbi:MAG: inositol monophosphatase [Caldilinea sp.]|nr:inositol monophosphatase [Caldilinea sp.]MDW8442185.1 inositol monophosphatase family protein [Caldilineaceae bacterium]